MHRAADKGHVRVVKMLLYYKACAQPRDSLLGNTPLHIAAHQVGDSDSTPAVSSSLSSRLRFSLSLSLFTPPPHTHPPPLAPSLSLLSRSFMSWGDGLGAGRTRRGQDECGVWQGRVEVCEALLAAGAGLPPPLVPAGATPKDAVLTSACCRLPSAEQARSQRVAVCQA